MALKRGEVILKLYEENYEQTIERIMLTKYGFKETDIPLEKLMHFN